MWPLRLYMASVPLHGFCSFTWSLRLYMVSAPSHGLRAFTWLLFLYMASAPLHGLCAFTWPLRLHTASALLRGLCAFTRPLLLYVVSALLHSLCGGLCVDYISRPTRTARFPIDFDCDSMEKGEVIEGHPSLTSSAFVSHSRGLGFDRRSSLTQYCALSSRFAGIPS